MKIIAIALFIFALPIIAWGIFKPVPMTIEDDFNFRWILPPEYYQGNNFHKGRAWVQEKKDGPWTLIDTEGNVIKHNRP